MDPTSKEDEPYPTPPPYSSPDESHAEQDARIYDIPPPSPPPSFIPPEVGCTTKADIPLKDAAKESRPLNLLESLQSSPRRLFVSYETELFCYPALTTCPYCKTQVTTWVNYRAGWLAWLVCLVCGLCGLVLGCCLIPFFVNYFKDAHHSCPRCKRVLHVYKRTCCE